MAEPTYKELHAENRRLKGRVAELECTVEDLRKRIEQLQRSLEESQRQAKRQAAPFSKRPPQPQPKRPGRRPGPDYGLQNFRRPPDRSEIDETYEALLPADCPDCGGPVDEISVRQQYQIELPKKPVRRQFNVHLGRCACCGGRCRVGMSS